MDDAPPNNQRNWMRDEQLEEIKQSLIRHITEEPKSWVETEGAERRRQQVMRYNCIQEAAKMVMHADPPVPVDQMAEKVVELAEEMYAMTLTEWEMRSDIELAGEEKEIQLKEEDHSYPGPGLPIWPHDITEPEYSNEDPGDGPWQDSPSNPENDQGGDWITSL